MRPFPSIKVLWTVACAGAALALLVLAPTALAEASATAAAGKPAAKSILGGNVVTSAAKPAMGAARAPSQVMSTPTRRPLTATTASTQETSSGTNVAMVIALIAAGLVLGGIAFVIVRDARSVAPVVEGAAMGGTRNPEGRLRKRRAQAKAARLQRKRHRRR